MTRPNDRTHMLTQDACRALGTKILALATTGETLINITSETDGGLRWGRNVVSGAHRTWGQTVSVTRVIEGRVGRAETNQLDDASIAHCVARAGELAAVQDAQNVASMRGATKYLAPQLYSAASEALSAADLSRQAYATVAPAVDAGALAAGYLSITDRATSVVNSQGLFAYFAETVAEYSTTMRETARNASGWAGRSSFDWNRIDVAALGARALHKCGSSAQPVAIEPGRYTTILEAQAVGDLFMPLARMRWSREVAENGYGPFAGKERGTTRLGQQILDRRLSILSDPMDPDGGYQPFASDGLPYERQTWIENGVLKTLAYGRQYAKTRLQSDTEIRAPESGAFRMTGGTSTVDEMIAQTERGVLVTRFGNLTILDSRAYVLTGNTRDGLWLVEHGKISKAIRNFRFTDSPFFGFSAVDLLGVPERIYTSRDLFGPPMPVVVPAARVPDFNFAATLDSV